MARKLKLVRVGLVSVDGTKVDANASKHRSVGYDRAKELVEQLRADIDELLTRPSKPMRRARAMPSRCPRS